MKYYEITLHATIRESVTVAARDEDDAAEAALAITRAGYTPHGQLDWDVSDICTGTRADTIDC